MERSPQLRERSEIIHHCSRGKQSGAKELSPGPPAPSPLRPSSLLSSLPSSTLFSSLLSYSPLSSSRLFSSPLSSLLVFPPLLLSSPCPPSPLSPLLLLVGPLARSRTDSPSLVQLSYSSPARSHRACARACFPLSACKKGSVPLLSAPSKYLLPLASPLPFSRITCTGLFLNEKKRKETPITHTRVNIFPPSPGENGVL